MAKTVIGLFDTIDHANAVVRDLVDMGISRENISLVSRHSSGTAAVDKAVGDAGDGAAAGAGLGAAAGGTLGLLVGLGVLAIPGIGPILAAGPIAAALGSAAVGAAGGAAVGGLMGALLDAGVSEEDANVYAESVRRGGTLVSATVPDTSTERVHAVMSRHNAININDREAEWRQGGWSRFDPEGRPYEPEGKLDEKWEESSKVGTVGGTLTGAATGAAVGSAGGPVGTVIGGVAGAVVGAGVGAAGDAAGEGIEDETFDPDTPAERARAAKNFGVFDNDFREHHRRSYASSGMAYTEYEPYYRYGHSLAYDPAFRNMEWAQVEPEARRRWEAQHPNTWERFKDAVQYSWDRFRGAR